jgi:hypothetical protein
MRWLTWFFASPRSARWAALAVGLQHLRQAALVQGALLDVVMQDFRQQVGGVHQGFLGGLAHHRADLLAHGIEQK